MKSSARFIFLFVVLLVSILAWASAQTTFYENPNDFYIFPTPTSESSSNVVSDVGSVYSSGGCITDWNCTEWGECMNNTQTRTCSKIAQNCYAGTAPEETQFCNSNATTPQGINETAGQNGTGPNIKENLLLIFLIPLGVLILLVIAFIVIKTKLKKPRP